MTSKLPLLVFTDLDGALLDHNTYDWTPALPALSAVKKIGGGIVLASSKTAAEMVGLRRKMGLDDWPAIVENGAGVLGTGAAPDTQETDYAQIRTCLEGLPTHLRSQFTGFGDLSEPEVAAATGLTLKSAGLAKQRRFSEPGLWHGSDADRTEFERALFRHGITVRAGGRFLTLSFGHLKSDKMIAIIGQFQPAITIALGDAPNDIEMLETADFGVIISNPDHTPLPPLTGEAEGRIIRTKEPGPTGWNTAVQTLLEQLELNKD